LAQNLLLSCDASTIINLTGMIKNFRLLKLIAIIAGLVSVLFKSEDAVAQDTLRVQQPYLFFPYPMQNKWQVSLGFTLTGMPEDVTEEVQVKAPVFDVHAIRRISKSMYLDGRIQTQFIQSYFSAGLRWIPIVRDRISLSVGDDIAWWYGKLNAASFRTNASGWQNTPNASLGYQFNDKVLMTLKGEALLNLKYSTTIAKEIVQTQGFDFSGVAGSIILEQPLGKKSHIITGFRGQYSNFFWQTWPLFETFDRRIFYPEFIVGFVL